MTNVLYENVTVELVGQDGNAFAILGRVQSALRRGGASQEAIRDFVAEATSGDYDHLLRTVMRYVNVEGDSDDDFDEGYEFEFDE
jgi:hypothetical protein